MTEPISPERFHASEGVDDWRVLGAGAYARFRTGSFSKGVELVEAIGTLADAMDHHPDVDLRYASVVVRLFTHDVRGLTERDVELARRISAAAWESGIPADPAPLRDVQLTVDALVGPDVLPFWRAVLGYRQVGDENLLDPFARVPAIWFQAMDAPRPGRNRIHVDVWVPHDQAEARVAAALEAGGRLVSDEHAPACWTLADAEGNELDLATWVGRDGP
jgi:4a-hydroxytetrahydrobiopterin dehydratase